MHHPDTCPECGGQLLPFGTSDRQCILCLKIFSLVKSVEQIEREKHREVLVTLHTLEDYDLYREEGEIREYIEFLHRLITEQRAELDTRAVHEGQRWYTGSLTDKK